MFVIPWKSPVITGSHGHNCRALAGHAPIYFEDFPACHVSLAVGRLEQSRDRAERPERQEERGQTLPSELLETDADPAW